MNYRRTTAGTLARALARTLTGTFASARTSFIPNTSRLITRPKARLLLAGRDSLAGVFGGFTIAVSYRCIGNVTFRAQGAHILPLCRSLFSLVFHFSNSFVE